LCSICIRPVSALLTAPMAFRSTGQRADHRREGNAA
jgi:hypothetical protein